jgi:hypothetical protein
MADPLSVLKDFCSTGRVEQVVLADDGRVYFADQYSFPKTTYTAFKSGAGGGDFYDLEVVVFYIQHFAGAETAARIADYVAGCRKQNIKPVALPDRKVWAPSLGRAGPRGGAKRVRLRTHAPRSAAASQRRFPMSVAPT